MPVSEQIRVVTATHAGPGYGTCWAAFVQHALPGAAGLGVLEIWKRSCLMALEQPDAALWQASGRCCHTEFARRQLMGTGFLT